MDHSESVWGKSFCWLLLTTRMCAQSCLTVCNPMDCSPLGSSIHGILQVRRLEWVAISFSRGSSWPRNRRVSPALARGFLTTELSGKPPYHPAFITEPWSPEWHHWVWEAEGLQPWVLFKRLRVEATHQRLVWGLKSNTEDDVGV